MKKYASFLLKILCAWTLSSAQTGRVGINTNTPQAMLHLKDSSVLFSGPTSIPGIPGDPPASGQGIRMMWYPDKGAFRAGYVSSTQWDKDNIGLLSFAAGSQPRAIGNISVALGDRTVATGYESTALGGITVASGDQSTAMGEITLAWGDASTATGSITKATGNASASFGVRTTARAFGSFALGRYNDSIIGSTLDTWVDTDPVFIIGNGSSDLVRNNAFTILKNGKTGIGIGTSAKPEHGLHLQINNAGGGGFADGIVIENVNSTTGEAAISFKNAGTNGSGDKFWITGMNQGRNFAWAYSTAFSEEVTKMHLDTLGKLGIGTVTPAALLDVEGTVKLGTNGTVLTEVIKATATNNIGPIPASTSIAVNFTVANAVTGSAVHVSPAIALDNGLVIAYARVSFANTIEIKLMNTSLNVIDLPTMDFYITVIR